MAILVSDSSVLIELERGGLLPEAFGCGLTMVVPDFLFENELRDHNGKYYQELGLAVVELTPDEVQLAQTIFLERPALSLEDSFALSCAHRPDHTLLAGDGTLRKEAARRNIDCRGVLWLLDQMLEIRQVSSLRLCEGLTRISQHPRCRLPKHEMQVRIEKWCASDGKAA